MDGKDYLGLRAAYLCGPMENCTTEEAREWRIGVGKKLNDLGFIILDPTEKCGGVSNEMGEEKEKLTKLKEAHDWDAFMDAMYPIVHYDLMCVDKSEVVFCKLENPDTKIIGTNHELIIAKREKKKVYIVVDFDPAKLNSWFLCIMRPENIYVSVESAIEQIKKDFNL